MPKRRYANPRPWSGRWSTLPGQPRRSPGKLCHFRRGDGRARPRSGACWGVPHLGGRRQDHPTCPSSPVSGPPCRQHAHTKVAWQSRARVDLHENLWCSAPPHAVSVGELEAPAGRANIPRHFPAHATSPSGLIEEVNHMLVSRPVAGRTFRWTGIIERTRLTVVLTRELLGFCAHEGGKVRFRLGDPPELDRFPGFSAGFERLARLDLNPEFLWPGDSRGFEIIESDGHWCRDHSNVVDRPM